MATISDLMQAFEDYFEAKAEHDKARAKHTYDGGYGWEFVGYSEIARLSLASDAVKRELEGFVQEVVQEELGRLEIERGR